MERAYVDEAQSQAICLWEGPDRKGIEELFERAQMKPEAIREVVEYKSCTGA